MSKTALMGLIMVALSVIVICGQGQTEQSTMGFPDQNLVAGPLLETISVPSESSDLVYTQVLEAGKYYMIQASGVFSYWDDRIEGADAYYDYDDKYTKEPLDYRPLMIDDQSMYDIAKKNGHSTEYNPAHIYEIIVMGTGKPLKLHIWDIHPGSYIDNHGSLEVKLFASPDMGFTTTTTTSSRSGQTVTTEKPERKILEGIPSPSQGDTPWCAWYSAKMVLDYYGYDAAPEAIAARTFDLGGRSWNGEALPMDLFDSYGNAIVALSDDNLQTKELTSRNREVLLNDLIDSINEGNPVIVASNGAWLFDLSSGKWLYDDLKNLKWPAGGHASVIVGYSLTNEGLVKELPILGVSPPAIRMHDSATTSIGIGTYWLSFNDFFNKVTADNSWLRLLVIQRNAEVKPSEETRQEAGGVVVPRSISECETGTNTFCGIFTLDDQGDHFNAVWENGAIADLYVIRWDRTGVELKRKDIGGVSNGMEATYTGIISGDTIEDGNVVWFWGEGQSSGKWDANW